LHLRASVMLFTLEAAKRSCILLGNA